MLRLQLRSHSHSTGTALLALVCATLLVVSLAAHSDVAADNILTGDDYLLDQHETNQRMLNALWLEQGMQEKSHYTESTEAVQQVAQVVLKKYWATLVKSDQRYDHYTPIVDGHFASHLNDTNYDIRLSGSIIKFSVKHTF